ncbi:phosphoribosylglycinamide synthetase [Planomonospora sphaerica]|uniref:Phosphoribosylglycinamide synthetase n=1 Tax=Planomonospora sphaerica TaxID=161355 RepID=A0A171DNQ8_9ACTN|nr:ATP-grasp domain-containing protein [Planomonospora sphaerica]GAT70695.1 phosphoribosylglycinamide synthetase [Planomonospora sphaerica]
MTADDRPLVLLIATGMRHYREYLLRSIATGYRIHLFATAEPGWEREYVTGWTLVDSTVDGPGMVPAALDLAAREPVQGVLCWDEARILAAAHVAEALGLPGGDTAMVRRCRDKHLTRVALDARGVPQPRSLAVGTLEEALKAAGETGYPAILKPRGLGGSLGVIRVEDPEELAERFAFVRDLTVPDGATFDVPVLVEEYADGPEVSVDAVVRDGVVTPLFLARKVLGYEPYCEEVGHYVDARDELLHDPEFRRVLQDTHTALGFTDGFTHTEIKLSSRGLRVIEVNGRLGGDMIPYLGLLTTGIDPGLAAAAVACGRVPDVTPRRELAAGVRFFYVAEDDTTIGSIAFDEAGLPGAVDRAIPVVEPGATVSPPPKGTLWGRVAYATAVSADLAECRAALDAAEANLEVKAAA